MGQPSSTFCSSVVVAAEQTLAALHRFTRSQYCTSMCDSVLQYYSTTVHSVCDYSTVYVTCIAQCNLGKAWQVWYCCMYINTATVVHISAHGIWGQQS